jgi:hypothetical protein
MIQFPPAIKPWRAVARLVFMVSGPQCMGLVNEMAGGSGKLFRADLLFNYRALS